MGDFHRHHYNFVAKRLRNHYPTGGSAIYDSISESHDMGARRVIEDIALEFAERFKEDDPNFNAPAFLDLCSPDPERWPLSELWDREKEYEYVEDTIEGRWGKRKDQEDKAK